MKKFIYFALLLGLVGVNANAAEVNTDHLMFPEDVAEAVRLAEEHEVLNGVQTADQNSYAEDKAWVGATQKEKDTQDDHGVESLKRRFIEE